DPELKAHYVATDHPVLGLRDMPAPPSHFSRSEVKIGPAPRLGEHNQLVFEDYLGLDPALLATLAAEGVLA
ncbi:MAG: hypothetical protein ABI240_08510, partial [Sphingomonas sp.]